MTTVAISGGFDPIHEGHIALIKAAHKHGDVVVILNSDDWLERKKGFVFHAYKVREEILRTLWPVSRIVPADDRNDNVCQTLSKLKPDIFANGGDRGKNNTPEETLCQELGIKTLYGVGGGKTNSSSQLALQARDAQQRTDKPWGYYTVIHEGENHKVKYLQVDEGKRTSKQWHRERDELMFNIDNGEFMYVPKGAEHRLEGPMRIIEIQHGICRENDIVRTEDDYGRV